MTRQLTWLILRGAALLVVLGLGSSPAQAINFWKNSVAAGNWSTGSNWSALSAAGGDSAGAPTAGEDVNIAFNDGTARTVTYDVAAPTIGILAIDLTGPGATTATLTLPGTINLPTGGIAVGGYNGAALTNGRGALTQSGGTTTTSAGVDLIVGWGAGSTGVYTLSGGALVNNLHEYIGFSGTGTFNHSGGSNTVNSSPTGFFSVGHNVGSTGTYNLSGTGALFTSVRQFVGLAGTGNFNQLGGSNAPFGGLVVGDVLGSTGVYAQSGGTNTLPGGGVLFLGHSNGATGTYNLSGAGALASQFQYVGDLGTGTFNHSGGTNTLSSGGTMRIANDPGSTGIYNLSGTGSLMSFGHAKRGGEFSKRQGCAVKGATS